MPNIDFGTPAALGFPALYANRNCVLTFPIISDATSVDPETGNIQPTTTNVVVEAIAHRDEGYSRSEDAFFQGGDQRIERLRLILVAPKIFPAGIGQGSKGTAVFKDGRSGSITIQVPTSSPYNVAPHLGTKFFGIFYYNSNS